MWEAASAHLKLCELRKQGFVSRKSPPVHVEYVILNHVFWSSSAHNALTTNITQNLVLCLCLGLVCTLANKWGTWGHLDGAQGWQGAFGVHLGCDFRVKMEMSHNGTDMEWGRGGVGLMTLEYSIVVQCTNLLNLMQIIWAWEKMPYKTYMIYKALVCISYITLNSRPSFRQLLGNWILTEIWHRFFIWEKLCLFLFFIC